MMPPFTKNEYTPCSSAEDSLKKKVRDDDALLRVFHFERYLLRQFGFLFGIGNLLEHSYCFENTDL